MDTKSRLENDLKEAMRTRNDLRRRTIRMALSAIKLAEVEKGGALDENSMVSIIQREIKGRREAAQDAQRAMRPDIITEAEEEIGVLEEYLPIQLSQADLQVLAQQAIQEVGATTPADMGKVMKVLMPKIQGRAPGDQVSQAVRQILQKT